MYVFETFPTILQGDTAGGVPNLPLTSIVLKSTGGFELPAVSPCTML